MHRLIALLPYLLLAALLAGLVVRMGNLSEPALATGDEALTALRTVGMMERGHLWTPYWNGEPDLHKPPLYYWLAILSCRLFGTGEAALRLPSVTALVMLLLTAFMLVKRLSNAWDGLAAAGLAAAHGLLVAQSRVAMLDTVMCLMVTLASLCLLAAAERPRLYLAWGTAMAAALLTKGEGASFVVPVGLLYVLLAQPDAFRCRFFYYGLAVTVLLTGIWFGVQLMLHRDLMLRPHYDDMVGYRFQHNLLTSFLEQRTTRRLWTSWGGLAPLLCLGPLLLLADAWRGGTTTRAPLQRRGMVLFALSGVIPLLMIALVRQQMKWYSLPAVVPTAALAALLVGRAARDNAPSGLRLGWPLLLLAGSLLPGVFAPAPAAQALVTAAQLLIGLAVAAMAVAAVGRGRWTRRIPAWANLAATACLAVAPCTPGVRLHRNRDGSEYRQVAAMLRAAGTGSDPVIINFRHYPQNCLMFYSRRRTVQLRAFSQMAVPPGAAYDAVIEGPGYGPFLLGLKVRQVGLVGEYRVLSVSNGTDRVITPAAFEAP